MKRALYLALFLALTAALAGGILSFVNDLTKDTIAAAQIEKEKENLEKKLGLGLQAIFKIR